MNLVCDTQNNIHILYVQQTRQKDVVTMVNFTFSFRAGCTKHS